MDLKKVQERLKNLTAGNDLKKSLFKPIPGKTIVRIVPYHFNEEYPFIELYFHYGIANRTYLSPITWGGVDPINEFADELAEQKKQSK